MSTPAAHVAARVSFVAARQHALITLDQIRETGMSDRTAQRWVNRGLLTRVAPRVLRFGGAPRTWESRAMAAVLSIRGPAVVSHRTAGHLWLPDHLPAPGRIEVTVPIGAGRQRRRGLAVHETRAWAHVDARRRTLVPVTGPARTLLDLCGVVDDLAALGILDEMRRRRLVGWRDLWGTLVVHKAGRRGRTRYRRILEERHGRRVPDTTFARLFLRAVAAAGLPEPCSEHVVATDDGRRYRLDAAYVERRVGIELDGKESHFTDAAFEADRIRDNRLSLAGWVVLRYTWRRFTSEPERVMAEIRAVLSARDADAT